VIVSDGSIGAQGHTSDTGTERTMRQ
jgi:hypothetical protein